MTLVPGWQPTCHSGYASPHPQRNYAEAKGCLPATDKVDGKFELEVGSDKLRDWQAERRLGSARNFSTMTSGEEGRRTLRFTWPAPQPRSFAAIGDRTKRSKSGKVPTM